MNALGRELCFDDYRVVPEGRTVTPEDVQRAVEILIQRRDTHLDNLADKLTEPRVARVVDAILSGANRPVAESSAEDIQYVLDLGLVARGPAGLMVANPIYREVIPREITSVEQDFLPENPKWYVLRSGRLDIEKVLSRFIEFYRENGEMITDRKLYTESAHHLTFMAWLQRIVNGGGYVRREYGLGLKFIDLVIEYSGEKFPFELKTEKHYKRDTALDQTVRYARRMGKRSAYLIVFRRRMTDPSRVGERETAVHKGVKVHIVWI